MNLLIQRASRLAAKHHHGQFRKHFTGVPYIVHPARVAARFATTDGILCAAAWCHDLLEDTACDPREISNECGSEVLAVVLELTNPSKLHPELDRAAKKAMDREHIAKCSERTKAVKAEDRYDNLCDAWESSDERWMLMYARESVLLGQVLGSHGLDVVRLSEQIIAKLAEMGHK